MNISSSARPASKTPFIASRFQSAPEVQAEAPSSEPQDSFTFSRRDDIGWMVSGVSILLMSGAFSIATKSAPMGLVGGGIGLAIAAVGVVNSH